MTRSSGHYVPFLQPPKKMVTICLCDNFYASVSKYNCSMRVYAPIWLTNCLVTILMYLHFVFTKLFHQIYPYLITADDWLHLLRVIYTLELVQKNSQIIVLVPIFTTRGAPDAKVMGTVESGSEVCCLQLAPSASQTWSDISLST